jgi:hypothetical protein
MPSRISGFIARWRRSMLVCMLLACAGVYSLGLLPHDHAATLDDLNCPVCHAVSGLNTMSGDTAEPVLLPVNPLIGWLLLLPWVPITLARSDKLLRLRQSRGPPPAR